MRQKPLEDGEREFMIASPENIVVNKLEWYKMGGQVSNRQWNDILGILRQQAALGVSDLLEHALVETDLRHS